MVLRRSRRYRLVVAPFVTAAITAGGAWWLIGMSPLTASFAGVGAGAGLWVYFRHVAGAAEHAR